MRRIFSFIGIITLNIALAIMGLKIYYTYAHNIIRTTQNPHELVRSLIIVGIVIGIIIYFLSKKKIIKRLGVGGIAFVIPLIIFLTFYLNRVLASEGDYKAFKLTSATVYENTVLLDIESSMPFVNNLEIAREKYIPVDSVFVRIDSGLFGRMTLAKNIKFPESNNCDHSDLDTTKLAVSHLNIGNELANQRCFLPAIYHYTVCIELDSFNNDCYYKRGLILMAKEEYEKAYNDFCTAALTKYIKLNDESIQFLSEANIKSLEVELIEIFEKDNINKIVDKMNNISNMIDFNNYKFRIEACLNKMNKI